MNLTKLHFFHHKFYAYMNDRRYDVFNTTLLFGVIFKAIRFCIDEYLSGTKKKTGRSIFHKA